VYAAVFPLLTARALTGPFDYLVPEELTPRVQTGSLVAAPLGRQTVLGVVVGLSALTVHAGRILPLCDVVDLPPIPAELLELAGRVRDYYLTSLGVALALVAPPASALKLEKTLNLTEAGQAALAAGEEELAPFARPGGAQRAPKTLVARLRRRGWLQTGYHLRVVGAEPPPRVLARGAAEPKRAGARQRAALGLLEERGPLEEALVRRISGVSDAGIASLLEVGSLRVAEPGEALGTPPRRSSGGVAGEQRRPAAAAPRLLPMQEEALAAIIGLSGSGDEVLLHGVTGSGKTEVYLRAAANVLARGESVLVLVPEIALTGQTVDRMRERFPDERIAVMHSGLSAGERLDAYRAIASGRARLVIGARSAVFAPLQRLGLVVVDEEHDASYKQENEPRYDARTVARWRARRSGAVLVLGSATPSVEAFASVRAHADLPQRVDGSQPPPLEIVDMRDVRTVLSRELRGALTATIEAGHKAILFLNRRGFAAFVACSHCGHTWTCPRCDVTLALFSGGKLLRCRTCGYSLPAPGSCSECGSLDVARYGYGTERLEHEVAQLVPGVELLRLDSDVASSFARLREVLTRFGGPGAKILVGTQMIAKGHHFPDVTLVGVVNADLELRFPDFRAEERTFAMLIQVGGRSGRGPDPGRVLVQTLDPAARPISLAATHDAETFYAGELERRRAHGYPPATVLVALEVTSGDTDKAGKGAGFLAQRLRAALRGGEEVMGPGPIVRERGRASARLVIKTTDVGKTLVVVRAAVERYRGRFVQRGVRLAVDVEPQWL
jgi:primosomal protein N' (replication factor Y) (superfamily II helicase)